jgi:hypothetical protein
MGMTWSCRGLAIVTCLAPTVGTLDHTALHCERLQGSVNTLHSKGACEVFWLGALLGGPLQRYELVGATGTCTLFRLRPCVSLLFQFLVNE